MTSNTWELFPMSSHAALETDIISVIYYYYYYHYSYYDCSRCFIHLFVELITGILQQPSVSIENSTRFWEISSNVEIIGSV